MPPQQQQTISTKTSRINTNYFIYLSPSKSRIQQTLRSYSMRYIKLRFHFFYTNLGIQAVSLMRSLFRKSASSQIICIFHILHSSSISRCCEYTFGKVLPLDFTYKRMFSTQHQKAKIGNSKILKKVHAKESEFRYHLWYYRNVSCNFRSCKVISA